MSLEGSADATVWDLDTVDAIWNAYSQATVNERDWLSDNEELIDRVAMKLVSGFREHTGPLGVNIDHDDLQVREKRGRFGKLIFQVRWRPETDAAQLFGGPRDGEFLVVPGAREGHSLYLQEPVSAPSYGGYADSSDSRLAEVRTEMVRCDRVGWCESGRHWIYTEADRY